MFSCTIDPRVLDVSKMLADYADIHLTPKVGGLSAAKDRKLHGWPRNDLDGLVGWINAECVQIDSGVKDLPTWAEP